jgi:LacI family fructose operon transcriptional repressor
VSKPTQKQTIYDIAQQVGASPSTVSAALNGTWKARRIKEETAQRFIALARQMGYR